jgi:hypothetical protein
MKRLRFIIPAAFMVLFSGCITIFEKYSFNKDGSGTMEYLVDMSELYSMMQAFSDSASNEEMNLDQSFADMKPSLEAVEGISNVMLTGDTDNYIFGIKYQFRNVEALNEALGLLMNAEGGNSEKFVDYTKKTFTRYHKTSDEFSPEALLGEDNEGMDESMVEGMLEGMKYKIFVTMPGKVKSVSTNAEYVTEGSNEVRVEANFSQMVKDTELLKMVIKSK